jgi:2,3-bisphosphoglycerate-independent phosphoglycerate mutase
MKLSNKVLQVVIDGYGYQPELEIEILKSSFNGLEAGLQESFNEIIYKMVSENGMNMSEELAFIFFFNRNPLNVYYEKKYNLVARYERHEVEDIQAKFAEIKSQLKDRDFVVAIRKLIQVIAREMKYAVWAASTPNIDALREKYPSISTKASGIEIGYEKLQPEVQGNSETGHQQLGNLTVAPQIPLEILNDIDSKEFYQNPILTEAIKTAVDKNVNLNLTFLLSGEFGDDGRVHSCWNHLEAFLEMLFSIHRFDPAKFRLQAILDGRDCALKSSIQRDDGKPGFLYMLKELLTKYNALESASWIIGRGIAMDRDYEEERTREDYKLLVDGEGAVVDSFNEALELVKKQHDQDGADPKIKPIIIKDNSGHIRKVEKGDVFVNLNFRSDRQRARVAALLGAKNFLQEQANKKNKSWELDWIHEDLSLDVYCITEYHPAFEKYGAKIVYPIKPHAHNFLSLYSKYIRDTNGKSKYLLIAESNKALHMGYFIKGRREKIDVEEVERRFVVPSFAEEDGIHTDDDFYKTPHMKAFEIAGKLLNELSLGIYKLAIINFSNPDMLGHLIIKHFEPNVKALEAIDFLIGMVAKFVLVNDYHMIITSDHGNIDEFSSSHSLNEVVTTFISPKSNIRLTRNLGDSFRLFDIPWALAEILGISQEIKKAMPAIPDWIKAKGLVGETPIRIDND